MGNEHHKMIKVQTEDFLARLDS